MCEIGGMIVLQHFTTKHSRDTMRACVRREGQKKKMRGDREISGEKRILHTCLYFFMQCS